MLEAVNEKYREEFSKKFPEYKIRLDEKLNELYVYIPGGILAYVERPDVRIYCPNVEQVLQEEKNASRIPA